MLLTEEEIREQVRKTIIQEFVNHDVANKLGNIIAQLEQLIRGGFYDERFNAMANANEINVLMIKKGLDSLKRAYAQISR